MRLTTKWMETNYLPAIEGIDEMARDYRKFLLEKFLFEHKELFPERTGEDGAYTLYSYTSQAAPTLAITTSVGCGKHGNNWDSSNWSSHSGTEEQTKIWVEFGLDNKVKIYKQWLTSENDVIQKVMSQQERLEKRIKRACDKVARAEKKSGNEAHDWFEGYTEDLDGIDGATVKLNDHVSMWSISWDELVEVYESAAECTVDWLEDMS